VLVLDLPKAEARLARAADHLPYVSLIIYLGCGEKEGDNDRDDAAEPDQATCKGNHWAGADHETEM
jgi:hypothetical protein